MASFEGRILEVLEQPFSGLDFTFVQERWVEKEPTRDFRLRARQMVADAGTLLDIGTADNEFLVSLQPSQYLT
jgi:hypothetical protein